MNKLDSAIRFDPEMGTVSANPNIGFSKSGCSPTVSVPTGLPSFPRAKARFNNFLKARRIQVKHIENVNRDRDAIFDTSKGTFYLKYQREVKLVDEYGGKYMFRTINQNLIEDYGFKFLVIADPDGNFHTTTRQQVREAVKKGYVRETRSQGETVVNIPLSSFKPFDLVLSEKITTQKTLGEV